MLKQAGAEHGKALMANTASYAGKHGQGWLAAWEVEPEAFAMALINEYRPGAPIGWHRDAPQYGIIAGISLLSPSRMKFRPYVSPGAVQEASTRTPRRTTHEITLMPRSGSLCQCASRSA